MCTWVSLTLQSFVTSYTTNFFWLHAVSGPAEIIPHQFQPQYTKKHFVK